MKIAVITSVLGMNDATIKDPIYNVYDDIDYFSFVDRTHNTKVWKEIKLPIFSSTDSKFENRRNAKLPKILGFYLLPGYDYYIWHDNYQEVKLHPLQIIEQYMGDNVFAAFKHPVRNCVYDEMQAVLSLCQEHDYLMHQYTNFLTEKNYPRNSGLYELSAFMYKNTPEVQSLMLSWWELICKYSSRDQVSFPYVLEKHNIVPSILPGAPRKYEGNNEIIPHVTEQYS